MKVDFTCTARTPVFNKYYIMETSFEEHTCRSLSYRCLVFHTIEHTLFIYLLKNLK